jgi:hypothetical protein
MPSMKTVKCVRCGQEFEARTSDIKRGWGKFCSKSCKAIKQTYGKNTFKPKRKLEGNKL